jgi:high-affinity nickel permease
VRHAVTKLATGGRVVTSLSVALAMILGTVLQLHMAARALDLSNGFWGPVQSLDLGHLGYGTVAVSVLIWAGAAIVWKKRIQPKERT